MLLKLEKKFDRFSDVMGWIAGVLDTGGSITGIIQEVPGYNQAGNLPSVTGAKHPAVLGAIYLASLII